MIRLIVSDIDGTLVEDGGNSLKPELYETILKLKEQGVHFVAASGRHGNGVKYLFQPILHDISLISGNGACIEHEGKHLTLTEYNHELAGAMIADLKSFELDIMIDGTDCVYTDSRNEEFIAWIENGYHFRVERLDDLSQLDASFVKISGCRMSGIVDDEVNFLKDKYAGQIKVILSGSQWIDTLSPGINKGNAVRWLQETMKIRPEETMAFGDQLNDIEMLNQAYYSFAVANARPEAKVAARFLADSNLRDGVYKILRMLVK